MPSLAYADCESSKFAPAGHGVRVFLGWVYDYEPDSTQSEFVEAKLASFGVSPKDHSQLIEYFRNLDAEIDVDLEKGTARLFCNDRVASLHELELLPVFNAFLDFTDTTYARYSAIATADLAGLGYPDLVGHLYQYAKDAGPFNVRFEPSHDGISEYFEQERAKICNQTEPPPGGAK